MSSGTTAGENVSSASGMSDAARRLVELLRPHTPFCEAVVRRQSERAGLTAETLTESDVARVGPMIATAVALFVDPGTLATLRARLVPR